MTVYYACCRDCRCPQLHLRLSAVVAVARLVAPRALRLEGFSSRLGLMHLSRLRLGARGECPRGLQRHSSPQSRQPRNIADPIAWRACLKLLRRLSQILRICPSLYPPYEFAEPQAFAKNLVALKPLHAVNGFVIIGHKTGVYSREVNHLTDCQSRWFWKRFSSGELDRLELVTALA